MGDFRLKSWEQAFDDRPAFSAGSQARQDQQAGRGVFLIIRKGRVKFIHEGLQISDG
jgi:hypothetical protein